MKFCQKLITSNIDAGKKSVREWNVPQNRWERAAASWKFSDKQILSLFLVCAFCVSYSKYVCSCSIPHSSGRFDSWKYMTKHTYSCICLCESVYIWFPFFFICFLFFFGHCCHCYCSLFFCLANELTRREKKTLPNRILFSLKWLAAIISNLNNEEKDRIVSHIYAKNEYARIHAVDSCYFWVHFSWTLKGQCITYS